MIFNKEKLRCLFTPPKNGSTTAKYFLQNLGWYAHSQPHPYPDIMIKTYPNLKNYKLYVFIRNPVERFISAVLFAKQLNSDYVNKIIHDHNLSINVEDMNFELFTTHLNNFKKHFKFIFEPQIKWLTVDNLNFLNFSNYEKEIRRISDTQDSKTYPLMIKNQSKNFEQRIITNNLIDFVETEYAHDCKIWREHFGYSLQI